MIDERKQKEIAYYDEQMAKVGPGIKESGSLGGFDPFMLASYQYLKRIGSEVCKGKKVLDYGCGNGIHLNWLASSAREVIGIDLSSNSLEKAREKIKKEGLSNVSVQVGDCESLDFSNETFDVVFNGGTFSSLNLDTAFKEIHRVLKPGGVLVGIETLGHNPLTNLKRKINTWVGKRTVFAADHIFKVTDIKRAEHYFEVVDVAFFHMVSWVTFPLLGLPGGVFLLKAAESIEKVLMAILPFLKKYSFKVVFIFKKHA